MTRQDEVKGMEMHISLTCPSPFAMVQMFLPSFRKIPPRVLRVMRQLP